MRFYNPKKKKKTNRQNNRKHYVVTDVVPATVWSRSQKKKEHRKKIVKKSVCFCQHNLHKCIAKWQQQHLKACLQIFLSFNFYLSLGFVSVFCSKRNETKIDYLSFCLFSMLNSDYVAAVAIVIAVATTLVNDNDVAHVFSSFTFGFKIK